MPKSTLIDLRDPSKSGDKKRGKSGSGEPEMMGDDFEPVQLYAKRKQIYPKLTHGKFRTAKWLVLFLTLSVYYGLPWIRWDHGPGASNQAVLADFEGERFYFFWIELWPQEAYYITGLLILAALGLFAVTALFGRVWCGYTCPQTVWTDLFIAVERFFEGDRNARMKLDKGPLNFNKVWRKTAKHAVWIYISFITGGAWILYWHDAPTLARTFFIGQAPMSAYVFAAILTGTTYALAGTMREQVCTYLCPWPRIQSALIDDKTLAVTYRSDRGEPRGPHKKGEPWEGRGDCIDCKQCVAVCPQGIDIRDGLQLECIHCALCIDACDDIMKKVDRPTGLIAYDTDENIALRKANQKPTRFNPFRPRVLFYVAILIATAGLMTFGLATRSSLDLSVLKDRSVAYTTVSATGEIQNAYTLKLINKTREDRPLELAVEGLEGAKLTVVGGEAAQQAVTLTSQADGVVRYRVFVTAPAAALGGDSEANLRFILKDPVTTDQQTSVVPFAGPGRRS